MLKRLGQKIFLFVFLVAVTSVFLLTWPTQYLLAEDNKNEILEDIDEVEEKIKREEQEKQKLLLELDQIKSMASRTQQEISKTQSIIKDTREAISRKEAEIKLINGKIEFQKVLLSGLLREMYYLKTAPVEAILLGGGNVSQFWGGIDHVATIEKRIVGIMDDIKFSKNKIEKDKIELEEMREDRERLLKLKEDQQKAILSEKYETQLDVREKELTIAELQSKLAKLRSNLSSYLGKPYNTKDIEKAASFSSEVSGVRKDFIMGMLVVESDLGRFTGGCYAKDSRMSGTRLELFKKICDELDYEWKKMKVSCPPRSYKGTGGAMGVAQFMSDTWMGYKSQIAAVTGHNPPDPWNLTDGVVAMGLKLAKGGATSKSGECNAAKLYLSGTTSPKYNWYCQKVKYWADNYEKLMD